MKRALLVGIDEYDSFRRLRGCCGDVRALEPLLQWNEDDEPNFSCVSLTSDRELITRDDLLANLQRLLAPAADVALLYFAGHGYPEQNDVVLTTMDGTEKTPGVPLSQVLALVQQCSVPEVVILLDCCFSGRAGSVPQLGSASATLRSGVSIITAARGDQTAAETAGRGVFATHLEHALKGGAADLLGRVTLAGLYAYLTEMFGPWDQRPTFKANIDRLHELRQIRPDLSRKKLRQLAEIFPESTYHLPLDPSYEPTEQPHDDRHEAEFSLLQAARAVKLVEPVGEDHLYWAAINSKACRLTRLGEHYWTLARQGKL
ncbi:Caspase domain-containing protein [Frankia torreyi]|uniref:Caspase domain-containing protein n=1 Tax=Frankia torreyi TaxID=1856 RepID=A0A0D8BGW1_9ACTN|nr:caspase family protein [Frankia sp. ArI3]KJE23376.1 Caspase domain-containing protein [Frankia torreyi]KQM05415.1 Caspase domain-containing protein [Frankia sp. CpI1-P]